MKHLIRFIITMFAIYIADLLIPGIRIGGNGWVVFAVVALILSILNSTIKPILKFLSCGLIILSLGLFTFIINGSMLLLASWLSINWFNVTFIVENLWSAILGSIIISLVTLVLNNLFIDKSKKRK